ncbi:hypothetical protein ACFQ6U_13970 [Streptomyces sp. NPDC056465]|uniref:hypothetical protein n=1 Tax=unclassified Streptomyces TaxID=2593676 RepID=UPI0035DFDA9D
MTIDSKLLVLDLIARTEKAVETVAHLAVDSGITFQVEDVVDAVERDLPAGYPAPTVGETTRRDVITQMAQGILSGDIHEGA